MPSFCAVSDCEFKYNRTNDVSFHKFPFYNTKLFQEWVRFTDRGPGWCPSRWSSICSRHFLPSDFRENIYRKCLKRSAVPSLKTISINYLAMFCSDFGSTENHWDQENVDDFPKDKSIQHLNSSTILTINEKVPSLRNSVDESEGNWSINSVEELAKSNEVLCRLCARSISNILCQMKDITDSNIMIIFAKCFPNILLDRTDNLPKKICSECLSKLRQFSTFADKVEAAQNKFRENISGGLKDLDRNERNRDQSKLLVNVKQEPVVNVKQEVVDFHNKTTAVSIDHDQYTMTGTSNMDALELENDAFCEYCDVSFVNNVQLKNHIVTYHTSDRKEMANNCEIMEVVTLENACIDLAVEEEEYILSTQEVLKVENLSEYENRENILQNILSEHNYIKSYGEEKEEDTKRIFKVEEIQMNSLNFNLPTFEVCEPGVQEQIADSIMILNCLKCPLQFDSQLNLDSHMKLAHKHNRIITCPICSTECKTFYQYLVHKSKHRHWKIIKTNRLSQKHCRLSCAHCSQVFQTKLALTNHRQFACMARLDASHKCTYCKKSFTESIVLKRHMKTCHRLPTIENAKVQCDLVASRIIDTFIACIKNSKDLNSLAQSAQNVKGTLKSTANAELMAQLDNSDQNDNISTSIDENDTSANDPSNSCKILTKINRQQKDEEDQFICGMCDRSYSRRSNLNRHLQLHRNKSDWDQKCKFCGKIFDKKFDLKRHFVRRECKAIGKTEGPLDLKMLIDSKNHKCQKCNKIFKFSNNLYQHKLTHSNERKYACKLCSKMFKRSSGLNQHVKGFHEKIKPHQCPVCQHNYALKGDMKRCMHSTLKNNC